MHRRLPNSLSSVGVLSRIEQLRSTLLVVSRLTCAMLATIPHGYVVEVYGDVRNT